MQVRKDKALAIGVLVAAGVLILTTFPLYSQDAPLSPERQVVVGTFAPELAPAPPAPAASPTVIGEFSTPYFATYVPMNGVVVSAGFGYSIAPAASVHGSVVTPVFAPVGARLIPASALGKTARQPSSTPD